MIEQIDLSDSLQEESVTSVQFRRVHVVHIVISTGLPVPCLITRSIIGKIDEFEERKDLSFLLLQSSRMTFSS